MNRSEYIKALNDFLSDLPDDERQGAISYHEELFDDAGKENEAQVIESLGSPRDVADAILRDSGMLAVREDDFSRNSSNTQSNTNNNGGNQQYKSQNVYEYNQQNNPDIKSTGPSTGVILILVLIAVLTSGLWLGVLGSLFGIFIGICAAGLGLIIGFGAGGAACLISGIYYLFTSAFAMGLITLGTGLILIALLILIAEPLFKLGINLFKWTITIAVKFGRWLYNWLKGVLA